MPWGHCAAICEQQSRHPILIHPPPPGQACTPPPPPPTYISQLLLHMTLDGLWTGVYLRELMRRQVQWQRHDAMTM